MKVIADTSRLVADGIITEAQALEIAARGREAMVARAINTLLCLGILAATSGLILWLADALAVAICGTLTLAGGLALLARGPESLRMFGNAAALIGAGMLMGGGAIELLGRHEDIAGLAMTGLGAAIAALSVWTGRRLGSLAGFVTGAILLMGLALHIGGLALLLAQSDAEGLPVALFYLYAAAVLAGAGWLTDVRLVTALAILPFAQALDTGTFYMHAAYVFVSPEPTLSILQMAALIAGCLWVSTRADDRIARHAGILALLGFVVANLCALVGSLWGDVVGETIWGPGRYADYNDWDAYSAAQEAFRAQALTISEGVYSVLWALALVAMVAWAAHRHQRGLFNAAMTFGAIHAYTQLFESFWDKPLAYVIAGLTAIPLAWGLMRLNRWMVARAA
ncbi:hypothetical protein [Mesobacterium pallidum]|uniref:hypothetical protein n=1 Tax=Mesobacterium pallidum TaxID=2872037 RepID=UPI001EE304C1|nr:hypothetical protein [Mesobacterium pallidum]